MKLNPNGEGLFVEEDDVFTGMGYSTRANTEYVLLAKRGSPLRLNADVHQLVMSPVLAHSEKPEEVARRIERLYPGPYLELFARREREGWTTWGNEVPPPKAEAEPPELPCDAAHDFARSLEVGYADIRERVAAGGSGRTPREPQPPAGAAADDDGLDIPAFLRRNGGAR